MTIDKIKRKLSKLLLKLRHWLIHKLGGYTEQRVILTKPVILPGPTITPHKLSVCVPVSRYMNIPKKEFEKWLIGQITAKLVKEAIRAHAVVLHTDEDTGAVYNSFHREAFDRPEYTVYAEMLVADGNETAGRRIEPYPIINPYPGSPKYDDRYIRRKLYGEEMLNC